MEHIPYFDAHCDTIYRCLRTGAQLRENDGHLDLRRASAFGRFAQVFALYQDPEELPRGSTMVREGQLLHQKFLREMEQNRDVIVPCRIGAEVDRAAADGKMAAILSIEGAELIGCDPGQVETAAEWGVRFLNPVWNWPNVLSCGSVTDSDTACFVAVTVGLTLSLFEVTLPLIARPITTAIAMQIGIIIPKRLLFGCFFSLAIKNHQKSNYAATKV